MPDETVADDEALFDIWRRLTPAQVNEIHEQLEELAARIAQLRGRPIPEALKQRARDLRDGQLHLGHLLLIRTILADE